MIALDGILTGKPETTAAQTARHQDKFFADPATLLGSGSSDGYYLSDGGYSRLVFDPEHLLFRLSSVSRDEVKARWRDEPAAKAAAQAATDAARAALGALPEDPGPMP
jgi:hypothetical protein